MDTKQLFSGVAVVIDDKINEVLIEYQSLSQKDKKSFIRLLESIFTPLEDRYKYKIAIIVIAYLI